MSKARIAADVVQMVLDLAGIVDPFGVADGLSALISLGRGRWMDAAISGASLIPYVGDLAKAGKFPSYLKTVRNAVRLGANDYGFAKELVPAFQRLRGQLESIPVANLPSTVQAQIRSLIDAIDELRVYAPNPKHEVLGAMRKTGSAGRRGVRTAMDLDPAEAHRLLNDSTRCVKVPDAKQYVAVREGKIYAFQPDGAGGFHGYPITGNEVHSKYSSVAPQIAQQLGISVKRLSRLLD